MSTKTETAVVDFKSNAVPSVFVQATPEPVQEVSAPEGAEEHDEAEHEEASAASDGDDSTAHPKKNRGVGKRINELTREKYEQQRRAEAAEARLAELEQARAKPAQTQVSGDRPTLEKFDYDYEAYQDALTDWKVSQKLSEREQQAERRQAEESAQERSKAIQARVDAYAEREPEAWAEALAAPIKITQAMAEALADSEVGPEIGVYLARNLDEADSISRMTPAAQIRAIGRIEARLETGQPETRVNPPKKLTQAPPPARTLKGGSAAIRSVDAEGITTEQRIALWRSQKSR